MAPELTFGGQESKFYLGWVHVRISGLSRFQLHWVLHSGSKLAVPSRGKAPVFSLGLWLGSPECYSSHGSLFFFRFFWSRKHHVVTLHFEFCENNPKRKWASEWKWGNVWEGLSKWSNSIPKTALQHCKEIQGSEESLPRKISLWNSQFIYYGKSEYS